MRHYCSHCDNVVDRNDSLRQQIRAALGDERQRRHANGLKTKNGNYATGCDGEFTFIDSTPSANSFKFCPFCGKALVEQPYDEVEQIRAALGEKEGL